MPVAWAYHVDVTKYRELGELVAALEPSVVVNAIEVSDPSLTERSPDIAVGNNALGAANVAMVCRLYGARLIHLSTVEVFGSSQRRTSTQLDTPYPSSSYGVSKLLGENAVCDILPGSLVIRYGSLYSVEDENCQPYIAMTQGGLRANNGPETAWIDNKTLVKPTYMRHLAALVAEAITMIYYGSPVSQRKPIHVAPNEDPITWYDLLVNDFQVRPFQVTPRKYDTLIALEPSRGWVTPGYREGLDAFIEEFREVQHSQAGPRT
jgi:dTDP-4-dehydrorhamnose reductase